MFVECFFPVYSSHHADGYLRKTVRCAAKNKSNQEKSVNVQQATDKQQQEKDEVERISDLPRLIEQLTEGGIG